LSGKMREWNTYSSWDNVFIPCVPNIAFKVL
jgi:hypothetical protein